MIDAMARFIKKFTLTLLIFVGGTALAFHSGASLLEYTTFATILLAIFGTQDLVDKKVPTR